MKSAAELASILKEIGEAKAIQKQRQVELLALNNPIVQEQNNNSSEVKEVKQHQIHEEPIPPPALEPPPERLIDEEAADIQTMLAQQAAALAVFKSHVKQKENSNPEEIKQEAKKEIKLDSEIIMPTLSLQDFICPITQQIFQNPMTIKPCGHKFEDDALNDWREKSHKNCPCCREKIVAIDPADYFFNNLLSELLKKNPTLQDEQYKNSSLNSPFSLELLDDLLKKNKKERLKKILASVSIEQMNAISEEKDYIGQSAVSLLLDRDLKLFEQMLEDSKMNEKIQPDGLNAIIRSLSGEYKSDGGAGPTLFIVFNYPKFNQLIKNPKFRAKISADGLNAIIQSGHLKGGSVFTYATGCTYIRKLFLADPVFRSKIRPEGLNAFASNGESSVNWFATTEEGLELLKIDPELRAKITSAGLNVIASDGTSAVSGLVEEKRGREILLADARLCSLISNKALFTPFGRGINKGKKPIDFLLNTPEGQQILQRHPHLRIDPDLNEQDAKATLLSRPLSPREIKQKPENFLEHDEKQIVSLFISAYQSSRNGIFSRTRSFWHNRNASNTQLKEIIDHINGSHPGYSGKKSRAIFQKLFNIKITADTSTEDVAIQYRRK